MPPHKLARVRWRVGQTLLPAHFQTQEQALAAEARLQAGLSGLPQYGIASLVLEPEALKAGIFRIKSMTALSPDGFLVDVPGNARVQECVLEKTDRSDVTLYLHRRGEEEDEDEGEALPETEEVPTFLHQLFISARPEEEGAELLLELGTVWTKGGKWYLSEKKVPPLLQVGSNPFLDPMLDWLEQLLVRARGELRSFLGSAQGNLLRKDQLTNARRAYCEVRGLEEMLNEVREGDIHPHPYMLFGALRRLYFEICCYRQVEPPDSLPAYRHDELGELLDDWLALFNAHFHDSRSTFLPTVKAFERQEDRFVLELGKEKAEELDPLAHEFYLLVKRKEPSAPPRSLEKVKLASPERLADVRRRALKGIPVQPPSPPGFAHDIPLDFDWHALRAEGEEWSQALRKKGLSLAFYVTPALEDAEVSLFWRGV